MGLARGVGLALSLSTVRPPGCVFSGGGERALTHRPSPLWSQLPALSPAGASAREMRSRAAEANREVDPSPAAPKRVCRWPAPFPRLGPWAWARRWPGSSRQGLFYASRCRKVPEHPGWGRAGACWAWRAWAAATAFRHRAGVMEACAGVPGASVRAPGLGFAGWGREGRGQG